LWIEIPPARFTLRIGVTGMTASPPTPHTVASREDWLLARKRLLTKERAINHALDDLRAERRALPWVRLERDYRFDARHGSVSLRELFDGRSQLAIYHFMLTPGSDHVCPGCSLICDHVDCARRHFEHADLSFAAVSRAPIGQIERVRERMGWGFNWVSSANNEFNYDFAVSFTPEQLADGTAAYNYGTTVIEKSPDMFGVNIFAVGKDDAIYHTYSTYHRGVDLLIGAFAWLDLTPKGRNEQGETMSWVKRHDEYADA
jgi:predicted dithiol-disulfide oxidoreductase (DUF899 family)